MKTEDIKKIAAYLGQWVEVDESLVKPHISYSHSIRPVYITQVVGINRINCSNNGFGNSKGELDIFPDPNGNWHVIDLRMIVKITKRPK